MAFTEFYCNPSGDNRNAGSTPATTVGILYAGSWVAATGVFTVTSGNPLAAGVLVGDFASVYTGGTSPTGFVGLVTARDATTITVSLTVKAGAVPADGSGKELRIGGAWQGPNLLVDFPFGFMVTALNDGVNLIPRVNFKNNAVYSITGSITHTTGDTGPLIFRGYTTTPGDGGRCTIQGPVSGASFVMLTIGASTNRRIVLEDFIFDRNGTTGTATGLAFNSVLGIMRHVSVTNMRGNGMALQGGGVLVIECDATQCNLSNTSQLSGIAVIGNMRLVRCYSTGNNGNGFGTGTTAGVNLTLINCIADRNSEHGLSIRTTQSTSGGGAACINCDFYANHFSGVYVDTTTTNGLIWLENCNFIGNDRYGVEHSGSSVGMTQILNCGFGAGTKANAFGEFEQGTSGYIEQDNFLYPADYTPYRNSFNPSDFSLQGLARHTGRGTNHPDIRDRGYPDVGAAAHFSSDVPLARASMRR